MPRKKINKYKDSDADGLPDELEKKLGTNPKKADSDNDGIGDYEEVNVYGTDPLNPDTDGDGVPDGQEVKRGRNPRGPGLIKDLFIPHEGNDFQPKALHPYRLLFYALSSILLKTILIGAVLILPIEAWLTPDILFEQSKKIISLTNEIRKNLSVPALAESPLLNQAAFSKAQDMIFKQYFAHTGPDNRSLSDWLKELKYNYAVAGENLAMGFSSPEDVVNGWTRSQTHYRNMTDPDFKEIGVGTVSGPYNNVDTTFVAQYFAAAAKDSADLAVKAEPEPAAPAKLIKTMDSAERVLGQDIQRPADAERPKAEPPTILRAEIKDSVPPRIDQERSRLYIDQPQGKTELIVRAEVYLSADAVSARAHFNNYFIDLKPGADSAAPWTGQTIIFGQGQEQIFNPVVLASVTAENASGENTTADLNWQNIAPAATTRLAQYYFIKQHQPAYIRPLFDTTSLFFRLLLLAASMALALNIFIQIKKQRPHIILSTLGLIGLLIFLIVI